MPKYRTYLISLALLFYQQAYGADRQIANQVSLSTSVSQEVDNNLFKAILSISQQAEGGSLTKIYDQVNNSARRAFGMARKYESMDAVTRTNTTQPIYNQGKIEGWRVVYTIELTTKQQNDLAALVGQLQSFMKVDGMFFSVSDETRKKAENELITKAISDFNERARIITKAQGKKLYSLVNMNISTGNQPIQNYPVARERSYVSVKSVAPPPVSGTIQIRE